MNIKDYIESGIVASFVLGIASETERKEFEFLSKQYPELIEAKRAFEQALEVQLMKEAVPVPDGIKERVLSSLQMFPVNRMQNEEREYKTPVFRINGLKIFAAACLLLSTGTSYFAFYFKEKYKKLQKANTELKRNRNISAHTNPLLALHPIVRKPSVKWSALVEKEDPSHCMAHVYWDSATTNTFLLVGYIPEPFSEKQFHLWTIVDNQAINLGMFDVKLQGSLIQMKNVEKANKFVVTKGQKGDSFAPLPEAIYAVGRL
jgi:anti-sigma-K factor RskA